MLAIEPSRPAVAPAEVSPPQCQFFVVRKKRLCRMTVRSGRNYCGEHEPQPCTPDGENDKRIPCPNDPKHTVYKSKLEKHLTICNARAGEKPAYYEHNLNAPSTAEDGPRRPLSEVSTETLIAVIEKINTLYEKHVTISCLEERPIHRVVEPEFSEGDRTESSLRHLRQASRLLWLAEDEGLVRDNTCYVELGAGKGQLSYYADAAWCGAESSSRVLAVDRGALRHKRDNRAAAATRLRVDLAHLNLEHVPEIQSCAHVTALAKHLCGAATDYALRCVTRARGAGVLLATCCHHRAAPRALLGRAHLRRLGLGAAELAVLLGVVSWATCGSGRSRAAPPERAAAGRRAKALLDWARVLALRDRGYSAELVYYVPPSVSLENVCIIAKKIDGIET